MATVYKKFSPQDFHIIPFNANKQYSFNSGSASTNSIKVFSTRYTSESISLYSSASTNPDGLVDIINNVKYNQIDHLFYRDFLIGRVIPGQPSESDIDVNSNARLGIDYNINNINYDFLNHKRQLYKHANVISIPAGTYGHSIKKGTFILSASNYITPHSSSTSIVDDSKGNLIISGTNLDNYVTDCRQNILNIGPVKSFKRYDLNTVGDVHPYDKNGHLIHNFIEEATGIEGVANTGYLKYLRGSKRLKPIERYTSLRDVPTHNVDDSYYLNPIHYINTNFSEKDLFVVKKTLNVSSSKFDSDFINEADRFPTIDFMGKSEIKLEHDPKFNFNKDEDFTINFWMRPQKIGTLSIGNYTIKPDKKQYLISKSTTKTVVKSPLEGASQVLNINTTGSSQLEDIDAGNKFPFEIYIDQPSSDEFIYFARSDGEIISTISASITSFSQSSEAHHITCRYSASQMEIFVDGIGSGISGSDLTSKPTQNEANLYIGNKGGLVYDQKLKKYLGTGDFENGLLVGKNNKHEFNGSLSQINIFNTALTDIQVKNHYSSSNGSPYVGNIFYSHGIATITHPSHQRILYNTTYNKDLNIENRFNFNLNQIGFSGRSASITGSHLSTNEDIRNIRLKPDGTKVFISGHADNIFQYKLNIPYNISTATFEKEVAHPKVELHGGVMANIGTLSGFTFNNDGSKIYTTDRQKDLINEITLTGSYDIGSMSVSKSIAIGSASFQGDRTQPSTDGEITTQQTSAPRFSHDGKILFFHPLYNATKFASIELSSSFDIGSHKVHILKAGESVGGDYFGNSGSVAEFLENPSLGHLGKIIDLHDLQSDLTHSDDIGDFDFNDEGTEFIFVNLEETKILHYHLSSSYDIWTMQHAGTRVLPLSSETYNDATSGIEGPLGIDWIEAGSITGSDSRIYITGFDNDSTNLDVIHEYHISKSEIHNIKYQGNHLIYEHEYQCSVDEHEYNNTYNISARKIPTNKEETIANFATGSLFKPFVTTIGLYNQNRDLLVVGKLGSPIRMSDETDTTFVLRWDV